MACVYSCMWTHLLFLVTEEHCIRHMQTWSTDRLHDMPHHQAVCERKPGSLASASAGLITVFHIWLNSCVPHLAPEQGSCWIFPWILWSSRIFWMKNYVLVYMDGANSGYISIWLTGSHHNFANSSFIRQPDFHLRFSMKNYSSSTTCTYSITFYDSFNVHKDIIKERQLSLNSATYINHRV